MSVRIVDGDALATLATLQECSVRCCVTSPPYWGLRDYGVAGQLGLERTPTEYVAAMVEVFREVRRVLADDGTLWLNLGDSYAGSWGAQSREGAINGKSIISARQIVAAAKRTMTGSVARLGDLKAKDLVGIPWRVAFALQADGWWLRSDIVWSKPNPMPESVTDRPTKSHEYLFLLTKSARYHYNADAIAEPVADATNARLLRAHSGYEAPGQTPHHGTAGARPARRQRGVDGVLLASPQIEDDPDAFSDTRNARTVWSIATVPFSEAHFATFPPELPRRCISAGSEPGDTVLDPFAGAGTTLLVADRLGRNGVGIELNPTYAEMARRRITSDAPLFHATGDADPLLAGLEE